MSTNDGTSKRNLIKIRNWRKHDFSRIRIQFSFRDIKSDYLIIQHFQFFLFLEKSSTKEKKLKDPILHYYDQDEGYKVNYIYQLKNRSDIVRWLTSLMQNAKTPQIQVHWENNYIQNWESVRRNPVQIAKSKDPIVRDIKSIRFLSFCDKMKNLDQDVVFLGSWSKYFVDFTVLTVSVMVSTSNQSFVRRLIRYRIVQM